MKNLLMADIFFGQLNLASKIAEAELQKRLVEGIQIEPTRLVESFAISIVVPAIVESLRKSGNEREILISGSKARELIRTAELENPAWGKILDEAIGDDSYEEKKLGFILDTNKDVVGIEIIKAKDTSVDDVQDVTAIFSSGHAKVY